MTKPMRQSKFAVFAMVGQTVKELFLPFIFFATQGDHTFSRKLWWLAGFLLVSFIFGVLRWFFFTYDLNAHEITVNQGVFVKRHAHVPFERIQTLTKTQPVLFQPFGVYQVRLETSGKKDDQLTFNALTPAQIDTIARYRQAAQTKVSETLTDTQQPQVRATYHINQQELVRYALTSFGSLGIMGVIFTILSEVSNHLPQHVMMGLDGWLRGGSVMFYATLAAGVILVGMGVAFIKIYNQYYGFTLTRVGQHLAIARGLFTKHTMQLRTTRVQAVQLEQSLLRRALHLQTVSVLLASANQSEKNDTHQNVLMPVVQSSQVAEVIHPFLPTLQIPTLKRAATVPHALRYQMQYALMWALGVFGLLLIANWLMATYLHFAAGFVLLVGLAGSLVVIWSISAWLCITDQRLTIADDMLAIQITPWFTKRQYYVRRDKIQGVRATQSLFMARHQTQHLQVVVRHGDSATYIKLRYLQADVVAQVNRWLIDVK